MKARPRTSIFENNLNDGGREMFRIGAKKT